MAARVSGSGGTGPSSSYSVGITASARCASVTDSAAPAGCAASGSGCELSARFASATASSAAAHVRSKKEIKKGSQKGSMVKKIM